MKLEHDKIAIESRAEIDHIQTMMQRYIKQSDLPEYISRDIDRIIRELDVLYMNW